MASQPFSHWEESKAAKAGGERPREFQLPGVHQVTLRADVFPARLSLS